jgi:4-diphosphocytidyl-2-C-methyl-D-erythritol kinase
MIRTSVAAKINLALVVGERRGDELHEVATLMQRIDLCDRLALEPGGELEVEGFPQDTMVRSALEALAGAVGIEPRWRVAIEKRIPLAAGLGGGSADAAAALRLANDTLARPLADADLCALAFGLGADVPFFLDPGPKLVEGAGERLTPVDLPQDFWVVVALPTGAAKLSTGDVYSRFDALGGAQGFAERRAALLDAIGSCRRPRDFGAFPKNDLADAAATPSLLEDLRAAGAFRVDMSGAGPAGYGLFHRRTAAAAAATRLRGAARVWVVAPVW